MDRGQREVANDSHDALCIRTRALIDLGRGLVKPVTLLGLLALLGVNPTRAAHFVKKPTRSTRLRRLSFALFLGAASAVPAWAAWTSSITGRVTEVRLFTPDAGIAAQTVWFSLANMPT